MKQRLLVVLPALTAVMLAAALAVSGSPGLAAPATTPMPTWTPPPAPWQGLLVNAGGSVYTDTVGSIWQADQAFTAGGWGFFGLGGGPWVDQTAEDIQGTADDGLFRTQRYWPPGVTGGYRFSVPNGAYEIALRFAEICPDCLPGDRIFDVCVEDVTVASNVDILGQYGIRVAVELAFHSEVTDERADIEFISRSTRSRPGHRRHALRPRRQCHPPDRSVAHADKHAYSASYDDAQRDTHLRSHAPRLSPAPARDRPGQVGATPARRAGSLCGGVGSMKSLPRIARHRPCASLYRGEGFARFPMERGRLSPHS